MTYGDEEKIRRFSSLERSPEKLNLSGRKVNLRSLSPLSTVILQKSTSGLGDFIIEFADGDLGDSDSVFWS
ncbi:unnamed protein product [Linum tenue]|uniref:Uncharacterized protein n=1 Tax=Linum tenue TaxID=586396 RepID=A0AAV0LJE9_9ROSI|nr:unnamed protein product [Linum tenue]